MWGCRRAGGGDSSNGDARGRADDERVCAGDLVDAQKGVLPGVTVSLKSKTQSEVLTAVTDGEGRFVFPIVRPDTYVLSATLEGFKTLKQTNLVVNANDKLSAGMLTLQAERPHGERPSLPRVPSSCS